MQFRIRTLLIITAIAALITMPCYQWGVELYQRWNAPQSEGLTIKLPLLAKTSSSTVVAVPDGGELLFGGEIIRRLEPTTSEDDKPSRRSQR